MNRPDEDTEDTERRSEPIRWSCSNGNGGNGGLSGSRVVEVFRMPKDRHARLGDASGDEPPSCRGHRVRYVM